MLLQMLLYRGHTILMLQSGLQIDLLVCIEMISAVELFKERFI